MSKDERCSLDTLSEGRLPASRVLEGSDAEPDGTRDGTSGARPAGRAIRDTGRMVSRLRIGVVGCGTGGPAAALALHRLGHEVEVFEAVGAPTPVSAGVLLQPTGLAALGRLGLREVVEAAGARVGRLRGRTARGRTVLDLAYADLDPGMAGLGIHRGAIFAALRDALHTEGIPLRCGAAVTHVAPGERPVVTLADGERLTYDLVVVASGARSPLRAGLGVPGRVRVYPHGALRSSSRGRGRRPRRSSRSSRAPARWSDAADRRTPRGNRRRPAPREPLLEPAGERARRPARRRRENALLSVVSTPAAVTHGSGRENGCRSAVSTPGGRPARRLRPPRPRRRPRRRSPRPGSPR